MRNLKGLRGDAAFYFSGSQHALNLSGLAGQSGAALGEETLRATLLDGTLGTTTSRISVSAAGRASLRAFYFPGVKAGYIKGVAKGGSELTREKGFLLSIGLAAMLFQRTREGDPSLN